MEKISALPITKDQLRRVNRCRIYLQVLTLSDIVDAHGETIIPQYLNGERFLDRSSIYRWPRQGRPTVKDWSLWEHTILQAYQTYGRNKLLHPVGRWNHHSHQQWLWRHDIHQNILHKTNGTFYIVYHPTNTARV